MPYEECFLCDKTTQNSLKNVKFLNLNTTVPGSQRAVRFVLEHLANCIRTKLIFGSDTKVCSFCFTELIDYDKLMVKLLSSQKKLTNRLQIILTTKWKDDDDDDDNSTTSTKESKFDASTKMQIDEPISNVKFETKTELIDGHDNDDDQEDGNDDEQPIAEADVMIRDDYDDEDFKIEAGGTVYEISERTSHECVACGETFKTKAMLHKHINETHNVKIFMCKICGAVRKDEEYLELHMNTHEGKTEFDCRYCPKRFSRPVNTLRHMRKHWDKKAYQCEKCGERFSQDNLLYNHRLRHEAEENPIICSICNQSFKSRKTYNHHKVTHQKHRPRHQCPQCPKSFTERYTLKMHMGTHGVNKETEKATATTTVAAAGEETVITSNTQTTGGGHTCVVCEKKFQSKDLLNSHLKDNHDVILK